MAEFEPTDGHHDSIYGETGLWPIRVAARIIISLGHAVKGTLVRIHHHDGTISMASPHTPSGRRRIFHSIVYEEPRGVVPPQQISRRNRQ